MEKTTLASVENSGNESENVLVDKNTSDESNLGELEIFHEKLIEKSKSVSIENGNTKLKKFKVQKNRGEKRKFPYKSDSRKINKKKKEEKSEVSVNLSENKFNEETNKTGVSSNSAVALLETTCISVLQKNSRAAENNLDVENDEKAAKPKFSKKSKAISNKCKEILNILLKLGSEVLSSMDESLKIIKIHSLLNEKYISIDILLDLISLALELNKASTVNDSEKELSLSMIIIKNTTPERSKTMQSFTGAPASPNNKTIVQDNLLPFNNGVEDVSGKHTLRNQDLEEAMEQMGANANAELSEKNEVPTVTKSGKNFCITNYFKKLKKNVEERDKNGRFSCFTTKTDMFLAPKLGGELTRERRHKFEEEFNRQNYESNYLTEHKRSKNSSLNTEKKNRSLFANAKELSVNGVLREKVKSCTSNETETLIVDKSDSPSQKRVSLIRVNQPKIEPTEAVCRTKAKLYQFHDNRRPPYWGTWRRKSESVRPRRPFGKDKMFNYAIDSDDEWEEEEEPGESLHGSDDEKEPEEDYEVDNDFFVPHGYLSDDENPEKENLSPKTRLNLLEEQFTSERKQKTRKMTPIVFGTFWAHKDLPSEGNLYQDLQIDKLQYVPWTSIPVEIEEEEKSQVKKSKQKIFPNEEIPNLIKMIHGSPQNCDNLAKKFLLYWETEKIPNDNRPGLTKICVQKKIKELASWQASHEKGKMCWKVPKETREEFGAEVENKTPEKKPRKCFIWKFVRKAEKNSGAGNPDASTPPVEPEVVIT